MPIIGKFNRAVAHIVDLTFARVVVAGLALGGAYLIGSQLASAYEDNDFNKRVQCWLGVERPDCPSYKAELTNARARQQAAETAEKAALARAQELQGDLDALKVIQETDSTFTVFRYGDDPPGDVEVTIATHYTSLVPPDTAPAYGCYIRLSGDGDVNRNWWFKERRGAVVDDPALRQREGISDAVYRYALSECHPTLIGDDHE